LCFLGAVGSFVLAVGWGRGSRGIGYISPHYSIFAVLALVGLYFLGCLSRPATSGRLVQMTLFLLVCLVCPLNAAEARFVGWRLAANEARLEQDIRAGVPVSLLAERHKHLNPSPAGEGAIPEFQEELAYCFRLLREAKVGMFKGVQEDPVVQERSVPARPVASHQMRWEKGTAYGYGSDPYVAFALDEPRHVYAIRLKYSMHYGNAVKTESAAKLSWRKNAQGGYPDSGQAATATLNTETGEQVARFWVNDTLDQFRLHPDNKPCLIKIFEITLEVPAPKGAPPPPRPQVRRFPFTGP
jgi:hypothetical protein